MATLGRNIVFPIKNADGTPFENLVLRKAVVDSVVMSLGDKITGDVYYHNNTLAVTMQEYIEYNNVRYYLVNPPTVIREGLAANNSELKGMTKYSFEFYHPMYMLANFPFSDIAVTNDEKKYLSQNKKFSWIGKPQDYIDKINKNLQGTQWIVAKSSRFPIEKDDVLSGVLSFDNNTIADALKVGYDTWDIPYVISQINEEEEYYSDGKRFLVEYGLPSNEVYASAEDKQLDRPFVFQYGQGVGLKNNSRTPKNNKIVTRISGYGSENNIPYGYPQIRWYGDPDAKQTPDGYPIYKGILGGAWVNLIKHPFTRTVLMPTIYRQTLFNKISPYLSDGSANPNYDPDAEIKDYYDAIATIEYPYVHEINPNAPSYEIHGFDDIKPELGDEQILGATPLNADLTPAESWDDTMDDDGNYLQSYFSITLPQLSFDIYACAAITEEMQINMRGGACIGCTFPIQIDWEDYKANFYDSDGNFVPDGTQRDLNKYPKSNLGSISVICQKEYATFGTIMPNIYQHPAEGDAFVILGISLPESYVTNAETRLDDAMKSYMLENNVYYYEYPLKFDEHFFATHTNILEQIRPNTIVRFIYGNEELALFVKQITIKYGENPLPQYDITLTDDIEVVLNQIGQVEEDVEHLGSLIAIMRETYTRNVWVELAKKLSKSVADTAQGVITFAKGLLFGDGNHGITENGDATLNNISMMSTQSQGYTGTDIISDKGFRVWEDDDGKSHMMVDYFSARIKAFFASLEIRKIEHSAGNRIESPAGNTLALVKKFDDGGHEVKDLWYARRYTFAGVSFGMPKLAFKVANYFGVWKDDPDAKVAYYRCYWTTEDKEDKKAVENNWQVGDQAFCQTFNLRAPQGKGYTSNKRYWRLVVRIGYETLGETEYAYVDLANELEYNPDIWDSSLALCRGYENIEDIGTPEEGDDIACLGNQIASYSRGGAIQYITYGETDVETGIPCVKMYTGISSFSPLDNFCFKKESPRGVFVTANRFTLISGSGEKTPITCYRGDWSSQSTYATNDIVQYHGSTWICTCPQGETTTVPPSEDSPYWAIYARRGASTPQLEVDSVNAIVSANYEGRITNISAATGLPTTIEVYVEGEQIPTSAWNGANSYVKYGRYQFPFSTQYYPVAGGINVARILTDTDAVYLSWEYRQQISIEGFIDPVINPMDIVLHVEFTHNGETKYADTTVPMIVQKAAASVLAQYSADGTTWEDAFYESHGHIYVHYSYDGGTTWTDKIRIVGKSIEFSRAITLYNTYAAMVAEDPRLDGVYLCNTDNATPPSTRRMATAWQKSGSTYTRIPITDEVNYLASSEGLYPTTDGHLFNADSASTEWADLGVIQGADGVDGISVTLDPATVIFEQDEDNTSTFTPSPSSFTATVNVWKGTTPLAPSSYKVAIQSSTNCTATKAGNQITSLTLGQDSQGVYYSSGSVVLGVWLDPTSTSQTPDTTLTFNWAANLLGTWKLSVRNDTMEAVSEQECAIYDENGEIIHVPFSSVFGQSAQNIFASVQGLKGRTGIDIEDGTITLDAERTIVTNDFEVKKVKTIPTESGIQIQIAEGLFQVFGLAGVANWRFGVNAQGQAILSYYNDAGQELYNLGPDGLSTIDNMPERFTATNNRYIPSSLIGKGGNTTYNIGSNGKILELLKSSVWEDMFKVRSRGSDLYLYGARKTVTSGGTIYYGRDNLPSEVTYSATAAIASIADGKCFTAREDLQTATTGAAVNSVIISSAVGLLVTSLQRIEFEGMTDSAIENTLYGLKIQHYNPYKSAIYDQLAVTDPGWFCNTFPTLSDIRANTIQIYTAILQDMAGNMFTVLQRKVYT